VEAVRSPVVCSDAVKVRLDNNHSKLSTECASKRIAKIGQYFDKIWWNTMIKWEVFLDTLY